MKDVTLNQREQARLQVLNSVMEYQLPRAHAAELLGISERQVRRILAAYRRDGAAALVHGNRGRRPRNAVPEDVAAATVILAGEKYAGFNHSHLTEVLAEREGIQLSCQTVSRLLNRSGLASARQHRPPKHRVRRERMPQEGMLLQVDGSHHRWLEDRGPRFVLLLAVDDATGTVANALFRPEEDTRGYFLLMEDIIHRYGIPLAITATATVSSGSMASHGMSPNRWAQPSSPGPCGSWALSRSLPVRHRPREGWNAWPALSRTGWSANSGWREPPPSTRPTPCWGTSSLALTTGSVCLVNRLWPPIVLWTLPCP